MKAKTKTSEYQYQSGRKTTKDTRLNSRFRKLAKTNHKMEAAMDNMATYNAKLMSACRRLETERDMLLGALIDVLLTHDPRLNAELKLKIRLADLPAHVRTLAKYIQFDLEATRRQLKEAWGLYAEFLGSLGSGEGIPEN